MIDVNDVTKRYGDKVAVDGVTCAVRPGLGTGFVGLDAPTAGSVRVNGRAYRDHAAPLHEVGAMLEARAIHPGRTAYSHLLSMAQTHAIGRRRVDEVIHLVGRHKVARKR